MKLFILLLSLAASPAFGWWCEGHEVVALIAEKHLTPHALDAVNQLLRDNPTGIPRSCQSNPPSAMAIASTWADDVKNSENTAFWHYLDIPLGLKKGNPETYCDPIGPSNNGGQRPGCVLSALRYAVNVLHSKDETGAEKAKALRYLIHFAGDLHQPLHTTSDNDRGGNCTPVQFFDDPKISNLHAIWDGRILNRDLTSRNNEDLQQFAADLDSRYATSRAEWVKNAPQFDKWAWEAHLLARKIVYGDLNPEPPVEDIDPHADCNAVSERFGALHIKIDDQYQSEAVPVVDKQIAKAGYRLAAILNLLFGSE